MRDFKWKSQVECFQTGSKVALCRCSTREHHEGAAPVPQLSWAPGAVRAHQLSLGLRGTNSSWLPLLPRTILEVWEAGWLTGLCFS